MKRAYVIAGFMGFCVALNDRASAQIAPDTTLNTQVASPDGLNFTITNGTTSGHNLFHSFDRFSVPLGGSATFDLNGTTNISTIFSRVTGRDVSSINGLIQTINSSNPVSLFLVNPNGILLGENARLNIGGSFTGTTATSVRFADGTEFSAIAPNNSLLTISVPIGLQFGSNPAAIAVQNSGHRLQEQNDRGIVSLNRVPSLNFQVASGQTLALIGGNLDFDGGTLTAEQGKIALGSVRSPGFVRLTDQGFDYSEISEFGTIRLDQRSLLDVSGANAGSIQIRADQFTVRNGSLVFSQNHGTRTAGAIEVQASQAIIAEGNSSSNTLTGFYSETRNAGESSRIKLQAPEIQFQNAAIYTRTIQRGGKGGDIEIEADRLSAISTISTPGSLATGGINAVASGTSPASNVKISARDINLFNAIILVNAAGNGNSGDIVIRSDNLTVGGNRVLSMISSVALRGDSGAIAIDTERLRLFGGGTIGTANFGSGSAGDVRVSASDQIEVTGVLRPGVPTRLDSSILSLPIPGISTLPTAHAGTVTLTTGRLLVSNGAEIAVRNEGTGNGGRLEINANEIKVDSAQLAASTRLGDGGDILLNVRDSLLLRDRAQILTNSKGNGGDITINAPVIVGINNSDIIANAIAGRGGNITINTQSLIGLAFRNLDNPINTPTNDISARSERNVSGNVNITTPKVDPDAGLIQLDTDLIDTSQTVAVGCAEEQSSQFIFTGRGGMPTNPSHQMNATLQPWVDLRSHPRSTQAVMSSSPRLQEATTWKRGATGQVELIAEHPTDPAAIATCAK